MEKLSLKDSTKEQEMYFKDLLNKSYKDAKDMEGGLIQFIKEHKLNIATLGIASCPKPKSKQIYGRYFLKEKEWKLRIYMGQSIFT